MRKKIGLIVVLVLIMPVAAMAAIDPNDAHTYYGCDSCHTVHNAEVLTGVPLWNGHQTTTTFTLYTSDTFDATAEQPRGSSKLCLSCHDGLSYADPNSGLNEYYDHDNNDLTPDILDDHYSWMQYGDAAFGSYLRLQHPISLEYADSISVGDTELWAPGDARPQIGGEKIEDILLDADGYLECAGCHDVHATAVALNSLRVSNAGGPGGSQLCKTCHKK